MKISVIAILLSVTTIWIYNIRTDDLDITPLAKFALNCEPCSIEVKNRSLGFDSVVVCDKPPMPPDDVIKILNRHSIDEEYKKWVLLIYLKLYKMQIITTHQSFETRDMPFIYTRFKRSETLSRAFCEIIGDNQLRRKLGPEFLPASKAFEFIEERHLFINDKEIRNEMNKIDSLTEVLRQK